MSMKKIASIVFAAVAAVTLLFGSDAAAQGCVGLATSSDQRNGGKFEQTFSARSIADVDLWILFTPGSAQRFANDHAVEVRIFTPGGYLYQSIAIPFTSDSVSKKP